MFTIYKVDAWCGSPGGSPVRRAHAVVVLDINITFEGAEHALNRYRDQYPGYYFLGLSWREDGDGYLHAPRPDASGRLAFGPDVLART